MIQGSTPRHTFKLPFSPDQIRKMTIAYEQFGIIVVKKTEADIEKEENAVSVKLTQEETLRFRERHSVKVQLKILTITGDLLPSKVFQVSVEELLDKEVLL